MEVGTLHGQIAVSARIGGEEGELECPGDGVVGEDVDDCVVAVGVRFPGHFGFGHGMGSVRCHSYWNLLCLR